MVERIVNGGFESGDLTGWTTSETLGSVTITTNAAYVYRGANALALICSNSGTVSASQSVDLTGINYIYIASYVNGLLSTTTSTIYIDTTAMMVFTAPTSTYQVIRISTIGLTGTHTLKFETVAPSNGGGVWFIDNVTTISAISVRSRQSSKRTQGYASPELEQFKYRKFHRISGSTADVTDYQIMLKIYPGSGQDTGNSIYLNNSAMPLLQDLRFVDENMKELPYWLETQLNDVAATLTANGGWIYCWVKVPLIEAAGTTIKVIWGYPTAASKSNGDLTFDLFDDFLGSALDTGKWEGDTGYASVSNSVLTMVSTGSSWKSLSAKGISGTSIVSEARAKIDSESDHGRIFGIFASDFTDNYLDFNYISGKHYTAYKTPLNNSYTRTSTLTSYTKLKIEYISGTKGTFYENNIQVVNVDASYIPTKGCRPACAPYGSRVVNWDWVLVRKYISPEPASVNTWVG